MQGGLLAVLLNSVNMIPRQTARVGVKNLANVKPYSRLEVFEKDSAGEGSVFCKLGWCLLTDLLLGEAHEMDWIVSLLLAMLRFFGIRVHDARGRRVRLGNRPLSAMTVSRNDSLGGWCVGVPVVGWFWIRTGNLRYDFSNDSGSGSCRTCNRMVFGTDLRDR